MSLNEQPSAAALAADLLVVAEAMDKASLDCVDLIRSGTGAGAVSRIGNDDILAVTDAMVALDRGALKAARLAALLAPATAAEWRAGRERPFDRLSHAPPGYWLTGCRAPLPGVGLI